MKESEISKQTDKPKLGRKEERKDGQTDRWMNGWMDGIDKWMNE